MLNEKEEATKYNVGTVTFKTESGSVVTVKEWLTMKDVAKMIGTHERTALRLVQTGKIKGIRLSPRKWRVQMAAVEDFLKQAELDAEARAQSENGSVAPLPGDGREPLTMEEAAAWLGVKPAWIRDLITMGKLPAIEVDGEKLIAPVDLEAYAANRKRKPAKGNMVR